MIDIVRETYLLHDQGATVNPDSYFLRFPESSASRVIALPARIGGRFRRIGLKWISSFPGNVSRGVPRASAVLVLNDYDTGYPVACLEGAGISAARTAASAALATRTLLRPPGRDDMSLAFVGAGVIARNVLDYLTKLNLPVTRISCHDIDEVSVDHFIAYARRMTGGRVDRSAALGDAMEANVVVFATTAARPYVPAETRFTPGQLLLNVSLRDLPPEILLAANNVVDDVDHCLKADTSPHLTEKASGSRNFVTGSVGQILQGRVSLDPDRPTIFSPFGLGVLDVAVGEFVLQQAVAQGRAIPIPNFFGTTTRW